MTARPMWTARWRLDARSAPRVARSARSSSARFARSLAGAAIADERGALAVVERRRSLQRGSRNYPVRNASRTRTRARTRRR